MAVVHPSRAALVPQSSEHRDNDSRSSNRHRSLSREKDDQEPADRRASPSYGDYKKTDAQAPWHVERNMYPNRNGGNRGSAQYQAGPGPGSDYFQGRREQREASTFSIWPSSPKQASRELSPSRKKSKRRAASSSSSSSSEEERRRRKKERKRRRKGEEEERGGQSGRGRDRSRDRDREKNRSRERDQHRRPEKERDQRHRTPSPVSAAEEEQWIEKPLSAKPTSTEVPVPRPTILTTGVENDDSEVGPNPLVKLDEKIHEREYGGSLLRGEGSAMAAFVQSEARIPRRGEIGLTSNEIASYESVGYVMSGSRHRRMNAVRMRKENQVISAEEKRGILKLQKEERERREELLKLEFKSMVDEKLGNT